MKQENNCEISQIAASIQFSTFPLTNQMEKIFQVALNRKIITIIDHGISQSISKPIFY